MNLPEPILKEAGSLLSKMFAGGWTLVAPPSSHGSFGDWYVDVQKGNREVRIAKDRSQYTLHGPSTDDLKSAGLWKAFDSWDEFSPLVETWALSPIN